MNISFESANRTKIERDTAAFIESGGCVHSETQQVILVAGALILASAIALFMWTRYL